MTAGVRLIAGIVCCFVAILVMAAEFRAPVIRGRIATSLFVSGLVLLWSAHV